MHRKERPVIGHKKNQELLKGAEYQIYSETPHGACGAYCFKPPKEETKKRPAIVFFHGGVFNRRFPVQFAPHCIHFSSRGMVAFSVEFRVSSCNGTGPLEALEDARSFLSYLELNADYFGVDLDQLVLGGNAAGGLLALHLASQHKRSLLYTKGLPKPKGLILYSPVSDISTKGLMSENFPNDRIANQLSPYRQIHRHAPPIIVFHGEADAQIPFSHSKQFVKKYVRKGNTAELVSFPSATHIDFNYNVNSELFGLTLQSSDIFLTNLGLLPPSATDIPYTFL